MSKGVAIEELGYYGTKDAVPTLINCIQNPEIETLQLNAVTALGRIGSEKAIPVLIDALEGRIHDFCQKGKYPNLKSSAAQALSWIGSAKAIPALLESLMDKDFGVKENSEKTLFRIQTKDSIAFCINNDGMRIPLFSWFYDDDKHLADWDDDMSEKYGDLREWARLQRPTEIKELIPHALKRDNFSLI